MNRGEYKSLVELTNEQELFANILQTIVEAPYCIHAQCQTMESSLPTAKFDLLVNHPVPEPGSSPATTCEVVSMNVVASFQQHQDTHTTKFV